MGRKKPTSSSHAEIGAQKSVIPEEMKKKGGKSVEEDDQDLNKTLDLDEIVEEDEQDLNKTLDLDETVEEVAEKESATSKKKKKKKKKREKNASLSNTVEITGKKEPKHVTEIREKLDRVREAEERKKREEEEWLRKEEEKMRQQEELERLAEEKKRLKKEREKEKRLQKKQEGMLLTAKQKEDARKSMAFGKQILADSKLDSSTATPPSKRPLCHNKKSKPSQFQSNAVLQSESIKPEVGVDDQEKEVDDDVDEEWDAKKWDDDDLKTEFEGEEVESFLPKKDITARKVENVNVSKRKNDDHHVVNQNEQILRSPICCIMGHVDAGKTKLLDCIRGTNVQEGEAGGITQQIGATYLPAENIRDRTKGLKADAKLNVPGLLVIDTPGHESFTNLRSRGSGLCDIAVLVVDIMHGLEPQTIESLDLLKMRNTDFIVALNKVDRLYGWKTRRDTRIVKESIEKQSKDVRNEFNMRLTQIITQFKEQGINTELYYKNKEMGETYNIVPTSAKSGEGIPDLLLLLVQWAQKTMIKRLTYSEEVQCTVLEAKVVEGHGTTIDVVLVNGVLHEGDQIVVCGMQGPIVTTIRALLTPHPMRELRVKGTYLHHKEIKAAQGIKIAAQGLEHTIAGTSIYIVRPHDNVEEIKEAAMKDVKSVMSRIAKSGEGVYVQASTLGSLEALLEFLKTPAVNIPVSAISIGPVHKKDVMKASAMLVKRKEYRTILAFDVKVTPEARERADKLGVKIFTADIIYHLFDQFKAHIDSLKEEKKREAAEEAVFPCLLQIMPNCVFNKKDPIVLGVQVIDGIAKVGTPICIPQREFIDIGLISSIENNHKPVDRAKKGQRVAIKIIGSNSEEQQKMFGRHFEIEDQLVSKISRRSVDVLEENYVDDLSAEEQHLLSKLKKLFKIW